MSQNVKVDVGQIGGGVWVIQGRNVWLRRVGRHGGTHFIGLPSEVREKLGIVRGSVCRVWLEGQTLCINVMVREELTPEEEQK